MTWTDDEAAKDACGGNQQAFRFLVERHSRSIFHLAFRMTGNEQDAEDLVQETFLRTFKQLHRFDNRATFATWLHRIAVNCALDHLRARQTRRTIQPHSEDRDHAHWLDSLADSDPSPERLTESSEIARRIQPALSQLSPNERAAFILRHYHDCDIDEIARTLGVQANAAKHSVFRAVQKLRRALQPAFGVTR